jgi:hypothetical protein
MYWYQFLEPLFNFATRHHFGVMLKLSLSTSIPYIGWNTRNSTLLCHTDNNRNKLYLVNDSLSSLRYCKGDGHSVARQRLGKQNTTIEAVFSVRCVKRIYLKNKRRYSSVPYFNVTSGGIRCSKGTSIIKKKPNPSHFIQGGSTKEGGGGKQKSWHWTNVWPWVPAGLDARSDRAGWLSAVSYCSALLCCAIQFSESDGVLSSQWKITTGSS